ncbi:MAG: hypothetical protein H7326_02680 [Bdellovibrionaceae bacterium]|nr:hypothetical protein [Pseudobdellovibrionaceae bacterium]
MKSFDLFLYFPFVAQGLAIAVDEFYFHRKRGLPRWERIGHPMDTLSVLLCFGFVLLVPYSESALVGYIALCAVSCLLVTKDEFVHQEICTKTESWLHAVLFILHPLSFVSAGFLWHGNFGIEMLQMQTALISAFLIYQILYWSPRWVKTK